MSHEQLRQDVIGQPPDSLRRVARGCMIAAREALADYDDSIRRLDIVIDELAKQAGDNKHGPRRRMLDDAQIDMVQSLRNQNLNWKEVEVAFNRRYRLKGKSRISGGDLRIIIDGA